jgi:hypothetical protein
MCVKARFEPQRLFNASISTDNLLNDDKREWNLRLTAINFANKYTLSNFLSTFSGTHYVTPRVMTPKLDSISDDRANRPFCLL